MIWLFFRVLRGWSQITCSPESPKFTITSLWLSFTVWSRQCWSGSESAELHAERGPSERACHWPEVWGTSLYQAVFLRLYAEVHMSKQQESSPKTSLWTHTGSAGGKDRSEPLNTNQFVFLNVRYQKLIISLFYSELLTPENNAPLRNAVVEWFTKQNLPQPVFEDTAEALGAKATFSVPLTCCSPGELTFTLTTS